MDHATEDKPNWPVSIKQVGLKVLQGTASGTQLISMAKTDQETLTTMQVVFKELEAICWKEFRRNQQLREIRNQRDQVLSSKVKEVRDCILELGQAEDHMLREIEIIQSKKAGLITCDQSDESELEGEAHQLTTEKGKLLPRVNGPLKSLSGMALSSSSIKKLENRIQESVNSIEECLKLTQDLKTKERCISLRISTLESKASNLDHLEEMHRLQLEKLKEEEQRINFTLSRKKRNLQVLKEHVHEVQVEC